MRKLLLASVAFFGITLPAVATQNSPFKVTVVDGPVLNVTDKSKVYTDSQEIYVLVDVILLCTDSVGYWENVPDFTLKLLPFDKHPPFPNVPNYLLDNVKIRIISQDDNIDLGDFVINLGSGQSKFIATHFCYAGDSLHVVGLVQYFATK